MIRLALLTALLASHARATTMQAGPGANLGAVNTSSTNTAVNNSLGALATFSTTTVVLPTLTKGSQGATGVSTQDLKDAGRAVFVATATAAGTASATMMSMGVTRAFASEVAATSIAVTSGKTLRIQGWCVTWRNNTAVAGGVTVTLRAMSTGTTTTASPVVSVLNASTALATIGSGATACAQFPDGIELSGNNTFGVSQEAVGTVVGSTVTVNGYQY